MTESARLYAALGSFTVAGACCLYFFYHVGRADSRARIVFYVLSALLITAIAVWVLHDKALWIRFAAGAIAGGIFCASIPLLYGPAKADGTGEKIHCCKEVDAARAAMDEAKHHAAIAKYNETQCLAEIARLERLVDDWSQQGRKHVATLREVDLMRAALERIADARNWDGSGSWGADSYPDEIARKALTG